MTISMTLENVATVYKLVLDNRHIKAHEPEETTDSSVESSILYDHLHNYVKRSVQDGPKYT